MTSSVPQSPLSSPGISDQDIEVVSPGNPPVEKGPDEKVGTLNEPIAIDVDDSDAPTQSPPGPALLQNESSSKPQDDMKAESKGAVTNGEDLVIDQAALSDEGSCRKDQQTSSLLVADEMGGENRSKVDLKKEASHRQGVSAENILEKDTSKVNGPATLLGDTETDPINVPAVPDIVGKDSDVDEDKAPQESTCNAASSLPEDNEEAGSYSVSVAEPEAIGETSDTTSKTKAASASTEPSETEAQNATSVGEEKTPRGDASSSPPNDTEMSDACPVSVAEPETTGEASGTTSKTKAASAFPEPAETEAQNAPGVEETPIQESPLDAESSLPKKAETTGATFDTPSETKADIASTEPAETDTHHVLGMNEDQLPQESLGNGAMTLQKDTETSDTCPIQLTETKSNEATLETKKVIASTDSAETKAHNVPVATCAAGNVEACGVSDTVSDENAALETRKMEIDTTSTLKDAAGNGTCVGDTMMEVDDTPTTADSAPHEKGICEEKTESRVPSNMEVDFDRVEPGSSVATDKVGADRGTEITKLQKETNVSIPSAGTDEGLAASANAETSPEATLPTCVSGKRSSPDEATDQPPAKKAKEVSMPTQLDIAARGSSQTISPDAPVVSDMLVDAQHRTKDTASKPDEIQSLPKPSEIEPSPGSEATDDTKKYPQCDPVFASIVDLSPIPDVKPLPLLSPRDIAELEAALQIGDKYSHNDDNQWRDDWSGNLQLLDKELLMNRSQIAQDPQTKPVLLPFVEWVAKTTKDPEGFRGVHLLFSYVYHMKGTPSMAQKIMAYSLQRKARTVGERLKFILDGVRRITYDPTVLNQDGWTTAKAESPEGVSGGAFLIGRRVIWHRYEAIVIAFVRDEEIGDLWKAIWLEDHDTFDLEADELQEALKKWERKEQTRQKRLSNRTLLGGMVKPQGYAGREKMQSTSMRFAASSNFNIEGIEHGIILATTFNQRARLGVPWPARVMNVSEVKASGSQPSNRRSSSKNIINVVFLAPYWNGQYSFSSKKSGTTSMKAATAKDPFSTGPLFECDVVEVSESTIKKYPFDADGDTVSIDKLRTDFRFLGLPKSAFSRYLAAHRLALAFKSFAIKEISKKPSSSDPAQAGALSALTDAHTLSVQAHMFPQASLDLPFDFILSKLPCPVEQVNQQAFDTEDTTEPVINLQAILKSMSPPRCFGLEAAESEKSRATLETSPRGFTPVKSPDPKFPATPASGEGQEVGDENLWSVSNFASDYLIKVIGSGTGNETDTLKLSYLGKLFAGLVDTLRLETEAIKSLPSEERKERLGAFMKRCLVMKGHGEDFLHLNKASDGLNIRNVVREWRKACERVYKRASVKCSLPGFGDGVTAVITDSRCNQHITASGSFERAVRLPAAIKGAKRAGAGTKKNIPLLYTVDSKYMDLAEVAILPKAHKASYLKRLKAKIANLPPDAKGMPLTDDSEGEGGEDTMGSRGSYTAAVLGVAAALQGVDMIVGGQCVNVFCAIRPPGHHAGRELRAMQAISNGFCLLNAAASAALYATAPQGEGGLGLKRVCIIDFDVHHGNGTQDILCSTHDSRFLYVSLHAGGAHINGYDDEGDAQDGHTGPGKGEGIFPGRCGDTSPHEGVLNIPLGQKVTAAAVGNALVTKVTPAVEAFCPELIILSAGFDAHKHDPLGMGGLSAEDFGSVTEVACQMAFKTCSGRVISVLEGGYGVPCCRPQKDLFLPDNLKNPVGAPVMVTAPVRLLDLGSDLPDSMEDPVTEHLRQKLERCHQEGFVHCVQSHVGSLSNCSKRGK